MKTPTKEDKQRISAFSIAIVITALAGLMAIPMTTSALTANAQVPGMTTQEGSTTNQSSMRDQQGSTSGGSSEQQRDTITIQKTAESTVDPAPGHSGHQVVMALPPRDDGKVWVGTVTWTASKPVEVVILQGYNSTVKPDAAHGSVLTAPLGPGKEVAISLVKTSS